MGLHNVYADAGYFNISIHPSRVGWDLITLCFGLEFSLFQSTHPVWDGTRAEKGGGGDMAISIHPSRVGWDRSRYHGRQD